jgi:hypothetical protein
MTRALAPLAFAAVLVFLAVVVAGMV